MFAAFMQAADALGYSAAPPELPPVCESKPDGTRLDLVISEILPEWGASAVESLLVTCRGGIINGPATIRVSGVPAGSDDIAFLLHLSNYSSFPAEFVPADTRRIQYDAYGQMYATGPVTGFDDEGRETFRISVRQFGPYGPFEVTDRKRGLVTRGKYGTTIMPFSWQRGGDRDPASWIGGLHGLVEQFDLAGDLRFRGFYCYSLPVGIHVRLDAKGLIGVDDFTDSRYGWLDRENGREVLAPGVAAWNPDPVFGEVIVPELTGTIFRKSMSADGSVDRIAVDTWPLFSALPDSGGGWAEAPREYTVDDWFTPDKLIRLPAEGEREAATLRVPDSFQWMRPLTPPFDDDPIAFSAEPHVGMVSQCARILTEAYDLPRSMNLPRWFWYQPRKDTRR
ncbi:hypothetical protein [Dongia sp.]|uniref:hypothetical protein n=1 Tax=Dongia sp. TaxID=1977262 RepID=UPI003753DD67